MLVSGRVYYATACTKRKSPRCSRPIQSPGLKNIDGDPPASRKPVIFPSKRIKAPPEKGCTAGCGKPGMMIFNSSNNQQTGGNLYNFPVGNGKLVHFPVGIWKISNFLAKEFLQLWGSVKRLSRCIDMGWSGILEWVCSSDQKWPKVVCPKWLVQVEKLWASASKKTRNVMPGPFATSDPSSRTAKVDHWNW